MSKQTIATGEKRKFRAYYLSRGDKPVSRVIGLEKLSHPILTDAGVNAWLERCWDGYNDRYGLVYIQLSDDICYLANASSCFDFMLDVFDGKTEGLAETHKNGTMAFLQRIASKPEAQLRGEYYPNMAVIEAYKAAGDHETARKLAEYRNAFIAEREAEDKRRREEEAERERLAKEKEAQELAQQIANEEKSLREKGWISGWGVVQLCDREGIAIHLRTRHNLLEVVSDINSHTAYIHNTGKRKPKLDGCFKTFHELKAKLGIE